MITLSSSEDEPLIRAICPNVWLTERPGKLMMYYGILAPGVGKLRENDNILQGFRGIF
jgi:hypothetical protein